MPVTATPLVTIDRAEPGAEPLLDQLKALLSIDFEAHDSRLMQCITAARQRIEKMAGVLLSPATVTAQWPALYDFEALPYGPVVGNVAATTLTGTVLTVTIPTGEFPALSGDYPAGIKLTYTAGYDDNTLPFDLAESVLNLAANLFDQGQREWKGAVVSNSRYTWAS